jgi:hypothetical protein
VDVFGGDWKEQAEVFSPSRCLGKSYCLADPGASPVREGLAQNYTGWYAFSENTVLEIRAEGPYLVAHSPRYSVMEHSYRSQRPTLVWVPDASVFPQWSGGIS